MKLHAYAQHSMRHQGIQKLQSRYFGPFQVLEKVGAIAYKLDLLVDALFHATVHISQLKLAYGTTTEFTPLSKEHLKLKTPAPNTNLERKMVKRRNRVATKLLVQWKGSPKEAT